MTGEFLAGLARANLAAAAAILLVLALRRPVRAGFGARAAYGLWIAPLCAAGALWIGHPAATLLSPIAVEAGALAQAVAARAPAEGADLATGLAALWLVGASAAAGLLARRQAGFLAAMGRLEPSAARGVFRAEHAGVGPAVVGVLRPRIVTPADFETRFGAAERELMLAHEAVHLRRGDAAVNALACAAQCLGWFNPLVHVAVRALRIDQELACDAAVIAGFPGARRLYAELLLKTQIAGQPLPLGCHWPAGAEHPLKARIVMLKSPLPGRALRRTGLAVALGVGALSATLAWAAQPVAAPPARVAQPDWIERPAMADLVAAYPAAALKANLRGGAIIGCRFDAGGRLANCRVDDEWPRQAGFGEAALQLADHFQARPVSHGQVVAGGVVRIPFRFALPGAAPAEPRAD